jgi:Tol biopolymer transport system component
VAPAGAGGMGEVYKARDTRLQRTVALKVLTAHSDRFEREARTVASLNHPHICVLHDIGHENGRPYMVMEFLEGETLADRIKHGPIPLDDALKLAIQIGDAVDRAHRAGVTHRDLKPGNIMLTRDGAKVLDFGLAKLTKVPPGEETLTVSTEGSVLGTPQFMAPELFEGKPADARSDIWAFGAVLYEMMTGKKAFEGSSYSSLVGAIVAAEPKPMEPLTPAWLERLVRRCLAKDPTRRYQHMGDIVLELQEPPTEAKTAPPRNWRPWAVAAICLVAAVMGWAPWRGKRDKSATVSTLEINPPEGGHFTPMADIGGSAIAPDGRTLAFVASTKKGEALLYLRAVDSLEAQPIRGSEGAGRPFWSPDSKSVGFGAGGKLKRVNVAGGEPATLCELSAPRGGSWNGNGVILFAERSSGLMRIPAGGGKPVSVTTINKEAGEQFHYFPHFLPGSQRFLYLVRHSNPEKQGIYIESLDGKSPRVQILKTNSQARYDPATRRLLYMDNGSLLARRLELDPPRLVGDPARLAENITINSGDADFSLSTGSTLVYSRDAGQSKRRFAWWDRSGKKLEAVGPTVESAGSAFRLSPEGRRVAYVSGTIPTDIWVLDIARGNNARLTFQGGDLPIWTPDGKQIYYRCLPRGICRKAADWSGEEEVVGTGLLEHPTSIAADGQTLLLGFHDIYRLTAGGGAKPQPWLKTQFLEGWGAVSPDGRWAAYHSNETGRDEIYVQAFPELRGKRQVSQAGGDYPQWSSDGRELYWLAASGTVVAAEVKPEQAGIESGKPEALFRFPETMFPWFQTSSDTKHFLVMEPEAGSERDVRMVVIQNWPAKLGNQP